MSDITLICKTVVGVTMSAAIAVAVHKTGNANCLWALFFVVAMW